MSWLLTEIPQIGLSCILPFREVHDGESAKYQNDQHESIKIIHHSSAPQQEILLPLPAQICNPDTIPHVTAG